MGYGGTPYVGVGNRALCLLVALCFLGCCFPASFAPAFSFDVHDEERAVDGCRWFRAALLGARAWVFYLTSGVGVLSVLSSHAWRLTRMFPSSPE